MVFLEMGFVKSSNILIYLPLLCRQFESIKIHLVHCSIVVTPHLQTQMMNLITNKIKSI